MSHRLFFIHIPKTAGTTFNAFLDQQFPLEKVVQDGFFGKHELYVRKIDLEGCLDQLKQFSLFRGHYGYEVCDALIPDYTTLTILRDPCKRVVSLYNDWRCKSQESLANAPELEKSLATLAKQLPFEAFLQADHPLLPYFFHNGQARLLAHNFGCELEGTDLQKLAMSHLDTIDYVGVTEAFDLFLWGLCERFGWHYPQELQPLNLTRDGLKVEDLDSSVLATIAAKNEVDLALYDRAKELALATANKIAKGPFPAKAYVDCQSHASVTITMADSIPGTGWHVLEGLGGDRLWRWTGPTLETTLFIRLEHCSYRLSIRVISVIDISILHHSEIRINGTPISTAIDDEGDDFLINGNIPKPLIRSDSSTQLTIAVPRTLAPTDVDSTAIDFRQKGLAIQSITLLTEQSNNALPNRKDNLQSERGSKWRVNRLIKSSIQLNQ